MKTNETILEEFEHMKGRLSLEQFQSWLENLDVDTTHALALALGAKALAELKVPILPKQTH